VARFKWLATVGRSVRRFADDTARRIRQRSRSAVMRAARLTGAALASYLAALALGLSDPPPLVAALTALIIVQVTLYSTLTSGVQRVLAVVSGVTLAVLFTSAVGLNWWSLGLIIAVSIFVGQLLRLGDQLIEVPISAMLVLGVTGAEAVAAGRIAETMIGAAVGVLVNVLFPPAVRSVHAGQAVARLASEIAELLSDAAASLPRGLSVEDAARWLDDARRLNRHVPRVEVAITHAEESRRLNPRALGKPKTGPSLRDGLEALEYCSVSMRTLFRSVHDVAQAGVHGDEEYATAAVQAYAVLLEELAAVVHAFGEVVRAEVGSADAQREEADLSAALQALRGGRTVLNEALLVDPREHPALWELNGTVVSTVDRMLVELDAVEHARMRETRRAEAVARRRAAQAVDRLRATTRNIVDRERRPEA
jgi:uncharacterized membrane protein YccC